MTVTITIRFRGLPAGPALLARSRAADAHSARCQPGHARQRQAGAGLAPATADTLRALLPLAEPAALLLAEAAGLGLLGRVLLATAFRSTQRAVAD